MSRLKTLTLAALLASGAAHAVTLPPAPVARNDSYLLNSLELDVSAPGLLANDSGTSLMVSGYFDPSAGTLTRVVTDGSFRFVPDRGFAGVSSFGYLVMDRYGRSASATVTIDASQSVPIANDDYYTATGATFTVGAPGLLANDRGGIGSLMVSGYLDPSEGTLSRVVTDGSFEYVAPRGFAGVASFSYINQDELGRNDGATVYIDYGASIPVAFDDSFSVVAGGTLDILAPGLLANDEGGLGALMVSGYLDPAQGTLERVVTDGSFRYRAPVGFVGTDTFLYLTVDDLGRSSQATVSIQVSAVPEPSQWLLLLAGLPLLARARRRR